MINKLIKTKVLLKDLQAQGWLWSCAAIGFDDEDTNIETDMQAARDWCKRVDIEVKTHYTQFYFKSREDQITFVLRWG